MGSTSKIVPIALPSKRQTHLVQADVSGELYDAVHKEIKSRKVKMRQIVEWGLSCYLLSVNPEEAERLGISADLQ